MDWKGIYSLDQKQRYNKLFFLSVGGCGSLESVLYVQEHRGLLNIRYPIEVCTHLMLVAMLQQNVVSCVVNISPSAWNRDGLE